MLLIFRLLAAISSLMASFRRHCQPHFHTPCTAPFCDAQNLMPRKRHFERDMPRSAQSCAADSIIAPARCRHCQLRAPPSIHSFHFLRSDIFIDDILSITTLSYRIFAHFRFFSLIYFRQFRLSFTWLLRLRRHFFIFIFQTETPRHYGRITPPCHHFRRPIYFITLASFSRLSPADYFRVFAAATPSFQDISPIAPPLGCVFGWLRLSFTTDAILLSQPFFSFITPNIFFFVFARCFDFQQPAWLTPMPCYELLRH